MTPYRVVTGFVTKRFGIFAYTKVYVKVILNGKPIFVEEAFTVLGLRHKVKQEAARQGWGPLWELVKL